MSGCSFILFIHSLYYFTQSIYRITNGYWISLLTSFLYPSLRSTQVTWSPTPLRDVDKPTIWLGTAVVEFVQNLVQNDTRGDSLFTACWDNPEVFFFLATEKECHRRDSNRGPPERGAEIIPHDHRAPRDMHSLRKFEFSFWWPSIRIFHSQFGFNFVMAPVYVMV